MINLKVLGAGCEVGRSGFLVSYKDSNILLDYGVKLSPENSEYPLHPGVKVQSIALSHAHFDHSGMIPAVFKHSNPWVYLTAPTLDLSDILWRDSIKISEREGEEPQYSIENVLDVHRRTQIISYKQDAKIAPNISINMYDAGHILGSALIKVNFDDGKSLLYTGDYKLEETRLHKGSDIDVGHIDYLAVESTYGTRDHPPREQVEAEFARSIKERLDAGGSVIIAAFAIGRAQEIIDILNEHKIHDYPIYLDGMAQKSSNVYKKYPGYFKNPFELRDSLGKTIWVRDHKMREKAVKGQSILITTAGMLEGGPVLYYLREKINDEKTGLFLTGFQVPGTKGQLLCDTGEIDIEGKLYKPKCQIKKFNFSAHIGKKDLFKSISYWNPQKVICIHGDKSILQSFRDNLKQELGIDAVGPEVGEIVKLE